MWLYTQKRENCNQTKYKSYATLNEEISSTKQNIVYTDFNEIAFPIWGNQMTP